MKYYLLKIEMYDLFLSLSKEILLTSRLRQNMTSSMREGLKEITFIPDYLIQKPTLP